MLHSHKELSSNRKTHTHVGEPEYTWPAGGGRGVGGRLVLESCWFLVIRPDYHLYYWDYRLSQGSSLWPSGREVATPPADEVLGRWMARPSSS